jgi:hypothetical protein
MLHLPDAQSEFFVQSERTPRQAPVQQEPFLQLLFLHSSLLAQDTFVSFLPTQLPAPLQKLPLAQSPVLLQLLRQRLLRQVYFPHPLGRGSSHFPEPVQFRAGTSLVPEHVAGAHETLLPNLWQVPLASQVPLLPQGGWAEQALEQHTLLTQNPV